MPVGCWHRSPPGSTGHTSRSSQASAAPGTISKAAPLLSASPCKRSAHRDTGRPQHTNQSFQPARPCAHPLLGPRSAASGAAPTAADARRHQQVRGGGQVVAGHAGRRAWRPRVGQARRRAAAAGGARRSPPPACFAQVARPPRGVDACRQLDAGADSFRPRLRRRGAGCRAGRSRAADPCARQRRLATRGRHLRCRVEGRAQQLWCKLEIH